MGGGASSVSRLRKSLVIRAYNMRKRDDTFDDQFRKYAFKKEDGTHCISVKDIRLCLQLESGEYSWVDDLFIHSFGAAVEDINYYDFIRFLDRGKMPVLTPSRSEGGSDLSNTNRGASSPLVTADPIKLKGAAANKGKIPKDFPPIPPTAPLGSNITITKVSPRSSNQEGDNASCDELHINLSSMTTTSDLLYPDKVNMDDDAGIAEDTTTIIVHPSRRAGPNGTGTTLEPFSPGKATPLWRKREVVRHERTVHYTTVEPDGSQQELVEKETTQTEVLHMESRETGEFAHRELTQFQQVETFNGEAVNEVNGQEEYVHLKSLEDEFHYSESTMPRRESTAPPDDDEYKAGVENEEERGGIAGAQGDCNDDHVEGEDGVSGGDRHRTQEQQQQQRPGYTHKHEQGHGPVLGHEDERYRSSEAHYKLDPEYVAEMGEKERELERERLRRMHDAYYYAEEHERENNEKMTGGDDGDQAHAKDTSMGETQFGHLDDGSQTMYGEPVCFDDQNNVSRTAVPPTVDLDDDILPPPTPADKGAAYDMLQKKVSATNDVPAQDRSSTLSRSASYESMHDID